MRRKGAYILAEKTINKQTRMTRSWSREMRKIRSDFEEPSRMLQIFNYLALGCGPMSARVLQVHPAVRRRFKMYQKIVNKWQMVQCYR